MIKKITIIVAICFIVGCNSPHCINDGSHYTQTHYKALEMIKRGDYEKAAKILERKYSKDDMLYTLDKAMTEHRAGQFHKSEETIASNFQKLKLSAESEVDRGFASSFLTFWGTLFDRVFDSDVVGTGTYRYAYGMQFRGQTAKYHLSTAEVTRIASFQLLNTLKTGDDNYGRVAQLNLADMQKFQLNYFDDYPFVDNSYNDFLMLIYFSAIKDTAGNSDVAYNRAYSENKRALDAKNDWAIKTLEIKLESSANLFSNLYRKNLENDLFLYSALGAGEHPLSRYEVLSTRLVSDSEYEELRRYILKNYVNPLYNGIRKSHSAILTARNNYIKQNKSVLVSEASDRKLGVLNIVVETGNAPRLVITKTKLRFCLPESYKEPEQELTISIMKDGKEIKSSKLINMLDPDLLIQLDYSRYFEMLCNRYITKVHAAELRLCREIASYYSTLKSYRKSLNVPNLSPLARAAIQSSIAVLIRNEPNRRLRAKRLAKQYIRNIKYDHRIWYSQPNKVYMATLSDVPDKSTLIIKRRGRIIYVHDFNIKSSAPSTLEIIGKL